MDPWRRFEKALQTIENPRAELSLVLRDVETTDLGTDEDRMELRAAVEASLAGLGALPIEDAVSSVRRAEIAGRSGWPNLYLAMAANRLELPELVLDAESRIPADYFDGLDLHWRTVQLKALVAEASLMLGDLSKVRSLVLELNREFRLEPIDEVFAPPESLVRRLINNGPPYATLWDLLRGINLDDLLGSELASMVPPEVTSTN